VTYKLFDTGNDFWVMSSDKSMNDIDDAVDMAIDDWRAGKALMAERKLLAALVKCPDHIDALHHLSLIYQETGRKVECHVFNMAAVAAGFLAIPKEFVWGRSKVEWSSYANRPFLRAYHVLGLWHMENGNHSEATEVFSRMLSLNPNDNIGVRYLLPACWLALNEPEKVIEHCLQYEDDASPDIQYSYALALVLLRKTGTAKEAMGSAVSSFPLVAKELLKKTHRRPASTFPGTITWGGADQAYEYWRQYGKYWAESEKAMQLLNIALRSN
jgi:tetratricopeptide (TPR) repeat protein